MTSNLTIEEVENLVAINQSHFGHDETAGLAQSEIVSTPVVLDAASAEAVAQTGETVVEGGLEFTEAEEAAAKFTYFLGHLKKEMGHLSAKGAARVITKLAEFPLGNTVDLNRMGFKDKRELQLFKLFYEINAAKAIIMKEIKTKALENTPVGDTNVAE